MTTVQVGVAQDRRALFQCPNCKVLMSHVMRALAFADALTDSSQASYDCGDARILARLQGNDLVLTIPLALIKRDIQ